MTINNAAKAATGTQAISEVNNTIANNDQFNLYIAAGVRGWR